MTDRPSLPPSFIVFDTEFTAWQGSRERNWSGPNEHREIVQIAAAKVDHERLEETDTFVRYVRPQKNPTLSGYFTDLTGITQNTVDREGVDYATALTAFSAWSGTLPMYCYGSDGDVMEENTRLLGIPFPFDRSRFADVRRVFQDQGIPAENYMSSTIVEAFGKKPARRGHEALNDVRTIIDGLRELRA